MNKRTFDSFLTDTRRAGICPVNAGEREGLAAAAAALEFAVRAVDLGRVVDKPELLDALAAALAFPPDFGHNWDALSDSLGDLSWLPAPGYMLILDHAGVLHRTSPEVFDTLLDILSEAGRKHAAAGVPLWVLLTCEADAPAA